MQTFEAQGFKLYKNLSNQSEVDQVLIDYEQILPNRHPKYSEKDCLESFYFWEINDLPREKGVYLVYDFDDNCIYVGSTPIRQVGGIRKRFEEHLIGKFAEYGLKVYCYKLKDATVNNILLLERAFIAALDPVFNNDELNGKRIEKYQEESGIKYHNWSDPIYSEFFKSRDVKVHRSVLLIHKALKKKYSKYFKPQMFRLGSINQNLVKEFGQSDSFDYELYENVLPKIIKNQMNVEEIINLVFVKKEMRDRKKIIDQIRNNFYKDGWTK